jgi:hypothetical protein
MTGPLLVNSGGGGNIAEVVGASSGGYPKIGISSTSADTNPPGLVIETKGTAPIVAGFIPDGTATGGNARGANAVDLQTSRTAATQVASGANSFTAGLSNTSSGAQSVSIGWLNTASGNRSTSIGRSNSVSGNESVAIGYTQTISGAQCVGFGYSNTIGASAISSVVMGDSNIVTTSYSTAFGLQTNDHGIYGSTLFATGRISSTGDAQSGKYIIRGRATASAAIRLTADGGAAGSANIINIPLNTIWSGTITVSARDTSTGNGSRWRITFGMGVVATAGTLVYKEGTVEFAEIIGTGVLTASALARSGDTTNRGINLTFTPPNANTWDVVAVINTSEVQ